MILDVLSASWKQSLESIWPAISCQLLIRRITEHLRKTQLRFSPVTGFVKLGSSGLRDL